MTPKPGCPAAAEPTLRLHRSELTPAPPSPQNWHPSFGYVNNCDGGRSHSFCDYRQA